MREAQLAKHNYNAAPLGSNDFAFFAISLATVSLISCAIILQPVISSVIIVA